MLYRKPQQKLELAIELQLFSHSVGDAEYSIVPLSPLPHMLGAAGMWLHINENFTIGNLKSSLLNIEQRYITMKLYFL
jgi:hypothetical protein